MKKQFAIICTLLLFTGLASAQKVYKLAKNSGKLILNISGANVQGYDGNEIIFTIPKVDSDYTDERAKGLMAINSSGFNDNTGIGLDVSVKGDEVIVNPVSVSNQAMVTVKLPQNMKLSFMNNNMMYQDTLTVSNVKTEIDVAVTGNNIILKNNVGPMSIKTLNGSVDATFPAEIKGPISIVSVRGHVDVAVPASVKANLDIVSNYGKIYAAEALKIAVSPVVKINQKISAMTSTNLSIITNGTKAGSAVVMSLTPPTQPTPPVPGEAGGVSSISIFTNRRDAEVLKGKINGGGVDILLKSNNDNVYIRKN